VRIKELLDVLRVSNRTVCNLVVAGNCRKQQLHEGRSQMNEHQMREVTVARVDWMRSAARADGTDCA
jgi:hypothetical protein